MTICFPAYFNDRARKGNVLARAEQTIWHACIDLEAWAFNALGSGSYPSGALHRLTGYPADLTMIAEAILRHLPPDRRGRFVAAFFEAPDAGANLAPVAQRFLAIIAHGAPPRAGAVPCEALVVRDYPRVLETLLAPAGATDAGARWLDSADLVISLLESAGP